jgi:hypothetical protein
VSQPKLPWPMLPILEICDTTTWSLQPAPPLAHVPVRQYRYGDDPVPLVPWLPGVFEHMRALVQLGWPARTACAAHGGVLYKLTSHSAQRRS